MPDLIQASNTNETLQPTPVASIENGVVTAAETEVKSVESDVISIEEAAAAAVKGDETAATSELETLKAYFHARIEKLEKYVVELEQRFKKAGLPWKI